MGRSEALALVRQVDDIYAARGKTVTHLDLGKDHPDEATILAAILGPTGNLRAPTLRKGRTLIVGFDPGLYARLLT